MACRQRLPVSSAARRVLAHERRAQKRNSSDEPDCGCHDNVVTERRGSAAACRANLVSGSRSGLIVFPGHQSFQRVELDGMRAIAQRLAQWLLIGRLHSGGRAVCRTWRFIWRQRFTE